MSPVALEMGGVGGCLLVQCGTCVFGFFFFFFFFGFVRLSRCCCYKPGVVGHNVDLQASPTAKSFCLSAFYFPYCSFNFISGQSYSNLK